MSLPKYPGKSKGDHLKGMARVAYRACVLARSQQRDGLVIVIDRDTQRERAVELGQGVDAGNEPPLPIEPIWALAQETLDAWMLGDRLAWKLTFDLPDLPQFSGALEDLWGKPQDPASNHPKSIKRRLLATIPGSTDGYQERLAEQVDPDRLAQACPRSFKPFVDQLRKVYACKQAVSPNLK